MPLSPSDHVDAMLAEATPVVARVVSSRLRVRVRVSSFGFFDSHNDDALECCARAGLKLAEKFQRVASGTDQGLESLPNYAASAAHNTVNDFFRRRAPLRAAFANRVARALQQPEFSTWEQSDLLVAGYVGWRSLKRPLAPLADVQPVGRELQGDAMLATPWDRMNAVVLGRLLTRLFDVAGGPLELNDLVGFLVELLRVPTGRGMSVDDGESGADGGGYSTEPPQPAPKGENTVIVREALRKFWLCAQQLRREWLFALLLNPPSVPDSASSSTSTPEEKKRDRNRGTLRGEIDVLPVNGIASIAEIGRVLDFTEEQYALIGRTLKIAVRPPATPGGMEPFYDVWPHLPLPDRLIGALLDTDKQIAALRRSACRQLSTCMTPPTTTGIGHIRTSAASSTTGRRTDR